MAAEPKQASDYDALVAYIKEHTEPGEFIFSGLIRHDKVHVNDVLVYFASGRHSGVRDYHMDPGSTTRKDIQQRIVRDIKRNNVDLIVLANFGLPQEPNLSRRSSGVTILDDYIRDNYVVREQFGQYFVLTSRKSSEPCATVPPSAPYGQVQKVYGLDQKNLTTSKKQTPASGWTEIRIVGWAATPVGSPPIEDIRVEINGQSVRPVIQCIPRDDLAARFGQDARNSGWQASIDPRDVESSGSIELDDISVEVIDRNGNRHSLPVSKNAGS